MTHQEDVLYECALAAASTLQQVAQEKLNTAYTLGWPHVIYAPRLSIDGNQWCALYGENLQDGVAGFGDSPNEAMLAFDKAWVKKLTGDSP